MSRVNPELELQEKVAEFADDPYGFVMWAYPWGEPGDLEDETGPDKWQEKILKDIGHALKFGFIENNGVRVEIVNGRIWIAVRSGHGIGKSALMAWLEQWFESTHQLARSVTTANTENQLKNKTWMEMAKWHHRLINKHWFKYTATKYICLAEPETWFGEATPWSESRSQGFAGTHAKFTMYKFDEASEIPDVIWEVSEGAMTEPDGLKIWIVFGNPTQATGRFSECFKKHRNRWITYEIDARDSKRTDHEFIQEQILQYGEDSDFIRVRVKGQEPRAGTAQFIGTESVELALGKIIPATSYHMHPKILGVDIARFGDDSSQMIKRQGLMAFDLKKYRGKSTQDMAGIVANEIQLWGPDATFLDMGNTGAAIYDILILWGYKVTGIWFGGEALNKALYLNKRAEMWGRVKNWLANGGCLPDDNELRDDLTGPEYQFTLKEQFQLESKKDMKNRGLASPDGGDALALTFAEEIPMSGAKHSLSSRSKATITDYDVMSGVPGSPPQPQMSYRELLQKRRVSC